MIERNSLTGLEIYLQRRPIQQFEKLMLAMGGEKVLKQKCKKIIDYKCVDFVYQWVNPKSGLLMNPPKFLLASTQKKLEELYQTES
jgi:hypothetical protein